MRKYQKYWHNIQGYEFSFHITKVITLYAKTAPITITFPTQPFNVNADISAKYGMEISGFSWIKSKPPKPCLHV